MVGCPECGAVATGHGRRRCMVRDLPISGRPTVLCWSKRLWCCLERDCSKRTWTQTAELIDASGLMTLRAGAEICRAVGEDGEPVARVAARLGIGWHAAMARVRTYGTPLIEDPARTAGCRAIGVDETTFSHAGPAKRSE